MATVHRLPWVDADADVCLDALKGELDGFVIAGYDKDGKLIVASSYADAAVANLLADKLKLKLFEHMEAK